MADYTKFCSDGSIVIHHHKSRIDQTKLKAERIMDTFAEVYGIESGKDVNPIVGTYFCIGSGNYIIVSNDTIYEYYKEYDQHLKCYTEMKLKRCGSNTVLQLIDVQQTGDDYTTYAKIIFKNGKIID